MRRDELFFTWAISHGHHHARSICGLGPGGANIDVGAVAVEQVVQQLRCRLHRPSTMDIDGVVSGEHGLSAEAGGGSVVVETAVQQFGLGSGSKRERHWKC